MRSGCIDAYEVVAFKFWVLVVDFFDRGYNFFYCLNVLRLMGEPPFQVGNSLR